MFPKLPLNLSACESGRVLPPLLTGRKGWRDVSELPSLTWLLQIFSKEICLSKFKPARLFWWRRSTPVRDAPLTDWGGSELIIRLQAGSIPARRIPTLQLLRQNYCGVLAVDCCPAYIARSTKAGFTQLPSYFSPQCKCGPVVRPVMPTRPMRVPAPTC